MHLHHTCMDALQAYGSSDDDADSSQAGPASLPPTNTAVEPVMPILPPPPGPEVVSAFPDAGLWKIPQFPQPPQAPKRRYGEGSTKRTS